jgi:hypothetical protein
MATKVKQDILPSQPGMVEGALNPCGHAAIKRFGGATQKGAYSNRG